jgi:hypothetical protein
VAQSEKNKFKQSFVLLDFFNSTLTRLQHRTPYLPLPPPQEKAPYQPKSTNSCAIQSTQNFCIKKLISVQVGQTSFFQNFFKNITSVRSNPGSLRVVHRDALLVTVAPRHVSSRSRIAAPKFAAAMWKKCSVFFNFRRKKTHQLQNNLIIKYIKAPTPRTKINVLTRSLTVPILLGPAKFTIKNLNISH